MNATEVHDAIAALQEHHPNLGVDGLRSLGEPCRTNSHDLAYCLKDHGEALAACRMWLAACPRTKTQRTTHDTYSYKHEVEAVAGIWIPHLALLVAAQMAGLPVTQSRERSWAGLLPLGAKRPGATI